MKKNQMVKMANILDKIFHFIQILNIVGGIICLFGILIVFTGFGLGIVKPSDVLTIHQGYLILKISEQYTMSANRGLSYGIVLSLSMAIEIFMIYGVCYFVRRILKPMKEDRPFEICISDDFKNLGICVLVYGLISNVLEMIQTTMDFNYYRLQHLADSDYVVSAGCKFQFDMRFMIVFLVLLLVSYIFRYGAELQQLSDETL